MSSPSVSIVFLVYNRRDELRTSLNKMLAESGYDGDIDVIVVDNASTDGSGDMVSDEFPQVRLITLDKNVGVSGWNPGFAVAEGDWVLALDDDCYLPPGGLGRAIEAAEEHGADLVSFKVTSPLDPGTVFTENYRTGLLAFWGCAALYRGHVIHELEGYDPEIFIWANELELMMRFFDRGYRHLHLPEVVAQHLKPPSDAPMYQIAERGYRFNGRHWGYIAGKLMHRGDAVRTLASLLGRNVRDGLRIDIVAFKAVPDTIAGFAHGLRQHAPVRKEVSRFYRRNFETFAGPWTLMRPPGEFLRSIPGEIVRGQLRKGKRPTAVGRREQYFEDRAALYPLDQPGVLKI